MPGSNNSHPSPEITARTAVFSTLFSQLKYPVQAANFWVIYCFITTTTKTPQKRPHTRVKNTKYHTKQYTSKQEQAGAELC